MENAPSPSEKSYENNTVRTGDKNTDVSFQHFVLHGRNNVNIFQIAHERKTYWPN